MKGSKEVINSLNGKNLQRRNKNAEMSRILSELKKMEAERSHCILHQR